MENLYIDLQIACENTENLPSEQQFYTWVQKALAVEAKTDDFLRVRSPFGLSMKQKATS